MKLVCKINNYQYGMAQFKRIKSQFAYQESYDRETHIHTVYFSFNEGELDVKWLSRLLHSRVEIIEKGDIL